jgi:glutathione S-transferase
VTGEMLRPLEGRPYLKAWQERMAETKPAKPVKVKRKKGKKAKR